MTTSTGCPSETTPKSFTMNDVLNCFITLASMRKCRRSALFAVSGTVLIAHSPNVTPHTEVRFLPKPRNT